MKFDDAFLYKLRKEEKWNSEFLETHIKNDDLSRLDEKGRTLLHYAIRDGNEAAVNSRI